MAQPVKTQMPEGLDLQSGYTVRVAAIDATTGNPVTGVNVGIVVLTAGDGSTLGGTLPPQPADKPVDLGNWYLVTGPGY